MQIKGMKTYGHWGPTPLGYGEGLTLETYTLDLSVIVLNLVTHSF